MVAVVSPLETELVVGARSIGAYSRLSYTMWYALAEFIDNSTQSRLNYDSIIDDVLKAEGTPLIVEIVHDRLRREISITDNSIGMSKDDLIQALKIAHPTTDSKGRSKYGMGLKTAACWIGNKWKIVTCEWSRGEEWTAEVDVHAIAYEGKKVSLSSQKVATDRHYTKIVIQDLHRNVQKRTEETIRSYLGSMYRFDLKAGTLKILYNGELVNPPDEYAFDTDPVGKPMRRELPELTVGGKKVTGWVGVLRKGGRRFGGFSLFQNKRQIQGYPTAWKPSSIYGGVEDEGANNLISQRLIGMIDLDGFEVSHTKDSILFQGDEQEELEKALYELTKDFRDFAQKRRGAGGQQWTREKFRDVLESLSKEFTSGEVKDAVNNSILPPYDAIVANNQKQRESLTKEDELATLSILDDLKIVVSMQERSEHDPHLTIAAGADAGVIHVIVNRLHPYYSSLESTDALEECLHQYIYDAIAEYRVSKLHGKLNPDSVRRIKNDLLRAQVVRIENAAASEQEGQFQAMASATA